MTRGRTLLTALASLGLLTACTSGSTGTVTGLVHVYGGPTDPTTGTSANTGLARAGQEVVVVDAQQHRTTDTSDAAGRYSFQLPPGTYTLMCGTMPRFTVTSERTLSLACDLFVA